MIAEMLIWGFFSALGWMSANWTVDQILSNKTPPAIEKPKEEKEPGKDSVNLN